MLTLRGVDFSPTYILMQVFGQKIQELTERSLISISIIPRFDCFVFNLYFFKEKNLSCCTRIIKIINHTEK